MTRLSAAILIAATLISANALSAPVKTVPPDLQKAADCMYGVLKKEPGFEKAKLGVYESEGFVLPYIQYLSPADKLGRRITVSFGAEVSCATLNRSYNCCADKDRYCFLALLNGLSSTTDPGPPDGDIPFSYLSGDNIAEDDSQPLENIGGPGRTRTCDQTVMSGQL